MNGETGGGEKRTAGKAYASYNYVQNMQVRGNPWTTLCPAPLKEYAWLPGNSANSSDPISAPVKGWACLVFDTYLDNNVPANQVVTGAGISNVRWVELGAGFRAVGFDYDRSSGSLSLTVHPELIKSSGVGGGRSCDYDWLTPNSKSDDEVVHWVF
jgi:hypothetical protein